MMRTISACSSSGVRERSVVLGQAADDAALLEDRDAVADRGRLVQLVGDEDDGDAGALEPDEHLLELRDALGREHRRRLVEDEHVRSPARAP